MQGMVIGSLGAVSNDHSNLKINLKGWLEVLEAAHIIPYADERIHELNNGLLLRANFHKLFDKGLISVKPDYEIKVSPRIRETYFNGKAYYRREKLY